MSKERSYVPTVLISSYLEAELVDRIAAAAPSIDVTYRPDLIPEPRYPADHEGRPLVRTDGQEREWAGAIRAADILFDFDRVDPTTLLRHGDHVKWVQATSAGIGRFVEEHGLSQSNATFTTAAGVHARPLAEFVLFAMLAFANGYPMARKLQRASRWERFASSEIEGATLAVVGLGAIGRAVARTARLMGMRVIGTKRRTEGVEPADVDVDALYPWTATETMFGEADYICLVAPHTSETEGMIDDAAFASMRPGAVLINIGRGALVDEHALRRALDDGPISGAVLDVAPVEPLPSDHWLWNREDVIIFPHSASTSVRENERLVDLFLRNLDSFLNDRPMTNVYRHDRLY